MRMQWVNCMHTGKRCNETKTEKAHTHTHSHTQGKVLVTLVFKVIHWQDERFDRLSIWTPTHTGHTVQTDAVFGISFQLEFTFVVFWLTCNVLSLCVCERQREREVTHWTHEWPRWTLNLFQWLCWGFFLIHIICTTFVSLFLSILLLSLLFNLSPVHPHLSLSVLFIFWCLLTR